MCSNDKGSQFAVSSEENSLNVHYVYIRTNVQVVQGYYEIV